MQNEIEEASSFWLTPSSLYRLITTYLQRISDKDQQYIIGDKSLKTLRLPQGVRNYLLEDYQRLPEHSTHLYKEWEAWLKGGNPHLSVTFDYKCASQNPDTIFITPLHPLIKQASLIFGTDNRAVTALKAKSNEIPAGNYEFAIYQWQFHGIREDLVLQPVASSSVITDHLAGLLEKSEQGSASDVEAIVPAIWENIDTQHYTLWSEVRQQHLQRTRELAAHRRESLTTSHKARILLLGEQLEQAENEKIQKMRQSQIAAAEIDYARRIQDLDIAMKRADITTEPVSYGVIQIDGDI